jgi:hypothetical protein
MGLKIQIKKTDLEDNSQLFFAVGQDELIEDEFQSQVASMAYSDMLILNLGIAGVTILVLGLYAIITE